MEDNLALSFQFESEPFLGDSQPCLPEAAATLAPARLHCTPSRSILFRGLCAATCCPLAARAPEARYTYPHLVLCAPHRPIARSSHLLVFCALTRVLSDGAARGGSAFGVELFADGPRSRSTLAQTHPAVRQRASVCVARSSCLRARRLAVFWLDWPSLVRFQGRRSALPLSQRVPPAASGARAARYKRQCGPRAWDACMWRARAAHPHRSRACTCALYARE